MANLFDDFQYKDFLNALITGNKVKGYKIVQDFFKNNPSIKDLYEELIKETLYKVGELWEENKISVATEHLATAITESILNSLFEKIVSEERLKKNVIVACVENEYHQVGIKMVADIFEMNGWDTHFLGANVPVQELISFSKNINPDIFALSLSIYFHIPILEKMIEEISHNFPDKKILIGGQAFTHGGIGILKKYKNVIYLANLSEIESFIKNT